jgi:hypothetical protein
MTQNEIDLYYKDIESVQIIKMRKEILEKSLIDIKCYLNNNFDTLFADFPLITWGLCDIIKEAVDWYFCENPNIKLGGYTPLLNHILEDIQTTNNIKFEKFEYYEPFSEKNFHNIKNFDDLELWYEKRIEALKNTIRYYEELIAILIENTI